MVMDQCILKRCFLFVDFFLPQLFDPFQPVLAIISVGPVHSQTCCALFSCWSPLCKIERHFQTGPLTKMRAKFFQNFWTGPLF